MAKKKVATRMPPADRKREIGDAVAYALASGIRNEVLSILAEGKRSKSELAKIMGRDLKVVDHHVTQLYECGCIEDAGATKTGNVEKRFYRTVILPYITDEAYARMTTEERRDVNGITVQSILVETLTAYREGKMEQDDALWLLWDALNLDAQGRREVADELACSYERIKDIAGRAVSRLAENGESGTTTIIATTSFERCRDGRPERGYAPEKSDRPYLND